jgi:hypothetical protein
MLSSRPTAHDPHRTKVACVWFVSGIATVSTSTDVRPQRLARARTSRSAALTTLWPTRKAGVAETVLLLGRHTGKPAMCSNRGLAHSPNNPVERQAARRLGIDDAAGVIGAHKTAETHQPEVRVNAYFGEYRGEADDRLWPIRLLGRILVPLAH